MRKKELNFVRLQKKYPGQWVAIDKWESGYRVVAHGADAKRVRTAAKSKGFAPPILMKIPARANAYIL